MKKSARFSAGVAVVLASMVLSACGGNGSGEASADGGDQEPYKIALISTLSGGSAQLGLQSRDGAKLAVDQINEEGGVDGHPLELIEYDGQLQPEVVVRSATRAASVDKVLAIVGPHSTGEAQALGPVAARLKVPFITPSAATTDVTVDQPFAFRTTVVNRELASGVVQFAQDTGISNPAILHDNGGFGTAFAADMEQAAEELGLSISTVEEFPVNATDMTAQLQSIARSGADGILIGCSGGNDAGLAYRQMVESSLLIPVFGSSCALQGDAIRVGGDAIAELPGIYGLQAFDDTKERAQQFMEDLGEAPTYEYSAAAYDAVQMLAMALEASGGEGGDALKEALEGIDEYEPVNGREGATASFSADKHDALTGDYLTPYRLSEDGAIERVTDS